MSSGSTPFSGGGRGVPVAPPPRHRPRREALPTDEASRAFHLVGASYAVLAMTDPELADQPFVAGLNHLEAQLADALRRAQADGELSGDRDASVEAARLIALNHGLGTAVLVGQRTGEDAEAVLRCHIDELFAA
ncbi:TetR family transcriptional regulator C-terminal domain-containing protein [Saccharopolyspora shandongensis]|uniref:TetR family transcriptional regulator C-terminal domain-containing protein n=1 Tax=Saccharopolyspora shandongensis TaxID=418495 RepID=UPI0034049CFE